MNTKGLLKKVGSEVGDFLFGIGGKYENYHLITFCRGYLPSEHIGEGVDLFKTHRRRKIITQTSLTGSIGIGVGLPYFSDENYFGMIALALGLKSFFYIADKFLDRINIRDSKKIVELHKEIDEVEEEERYSGGEEWKRGTDYPLS